MSDISANLLSLRSSVPAFVKIVAVSKTKPVSDILEAYGTGQRIFGENRVKELLVKKDQLPGDIEWHMIGHLQSNKVKGILTFIKVIHSVDSLRLLKVINDESQKINRKTDCLLEIHIAGEETKSGFNFDELLAMCGSPAFKGFSNVNIRGVMGMATFTSDSLQVRKEFRFLKECFDILRTGFFSDNDGFKEISMGMSGDYKIAVEEGSTMIRVGSLIFGERNYL